MVRPDTVLEAIRTTIEESGRLPDATSYATFELDTDGGQSNVRPPVVEITASNTIRNRPHNTDFVGYSTDNAGNHIGRIYDAKFDMEVEIDVWTAEGGSFDPDEIGEQVRLALYRHDKHQRDDRLPDPEDTSSTLDGVDYVSVGDGSVRNDLSMTPALRRWRQTVDVWFRETVNTAEEYGSEDYIVNVVTPTSSGMQGGTDAEIVFRAT